MKLWEQIEGTQKQLEHNTKLGRKELGKWSISLRSDGISLRYDGIYSSFTIPYADWSRLRDKIDEMLEM